MPSVLPTPRFARVEEQRIGELFDARHSTNTKRNTSWAFKIFNGMLLRSIFVSNKYIHFAIESTDAYRLKSHDTTPYRDTVSLCLSVSPADDTGIDWLIELYTGISLISLPVCNPRLVASTYAKWRVNLTLKKRRKKRIIKLCGFGISK